jgi:hypothetical protein
VLWKLDLSKTLSTLPLLNILKKKSTFWFDCLKCIESKRIWKFFFNLYWGCVWMSFPLSSISVLNLTACTLWIFCLVGGVCVFVHAFLYVCSEDLGTHVQFFFKEGPRARIVWVSVTTPAVSAR